MVAGYKKGIRRVSTFYLVGILASLLLYWFEGWQHSYMMPRSAVVIILLVMISLPWAFLNALDLLDPSKRHRSKGELLVHSIVFLFVAIFILFIRLPH